MLPGICSDILSDILYGMCSGPGVAPTASGARDMARVRCPQSELAEEETRRRKRRKKEEKAEEGVAPLLKSRDPHLARGKNTGKNESKLGVGEVLAGH